MTSRDRNDATTHAQPANDMARINTTQKGGASAGKDASSGRKRRRGGGGGGDDNDDGANKDDSNNRASKRLRNDKSTTGGGKKNVKETSKEGPSADGPRRSRRGRTSGDSSSNTLNTTTGEIASPEAAAAPKETRSKPSKAGRPPKKTKTAKAAEEATEAAPPDKPSRQTRQSKAAKDKPAEAKGKKATRAEEKAARKQAEESADTAADTTTTTDKPRRGRPRTSHASAEAAVEAPATKSPPATKRTKKAKTSKPSAEKSPAASPPSRPQPRQTVEKNDEREKEWEEEEGEEGEEEEDADEEEDTNQYGPFRQLVSHTRLVPLATMANKWAPLDRDAIAAVQALLDECARPVLARLGSSADKRERQEIARQAVAGVTRRLRSKLIKGIPFPIEGTGNRKKNNNSNTKKSARSRLHRSDSTAVSFLAEPTAEMHALQNQLTPLQHAVALLESERRREEAALADEYAQLRALETNAQAELRTWRERQRRQHVLADSATISSSSSSSSTHPNSTPNSTPNSNPNSNPISNPISKDAKPALFSDSYDSSVVDLAALSSHMESMRSNLQQIDGVAAAMVRSRAALQDVLGERLSGDQYERVLLGRWSTAG